MPNNYVLIEKITVGAAGAASVTFANIPQTGYTDLVLKVSARSSRAAEEDGLGITVNSASSGYTYRLLLGNGSSASSASTPFEQVWATRINGNSTTSNTFANSEFYFPNYAGSTAKSYSGDSVTENNGTNAFATLSATLQSSTSPITSLTLQALNASLMANSTFYLYGVAKLGTTPAIAPKASGGDIIDTDGTYWYHTFLSSGTFTPAANLTTDYLVVAGGGAGGGGNGGGGGGAGGLRCTVGATGGGGSLESALALASGTGYTVTIGAGGTQVSENDGTNGSNSVFATITSTGGGAGGGYGSGTSGGSGGGSSRTGTGSAGTSGQGYAGGSSTAFADYGTGGGGGAGAVGQTGTTTVNGNGGNGVATLISGTSVNYAGGGGGGRTDGLAGNTTGGTGGGGAGNLGTSPGVAGTANRGGGGGGAGKDTLGGTTYLAGNGGSGIVIIRYAVA